MTVSSDPFALSGMREANARHVAPMRAFLTAIVNDPPAHARFMNMLSMLEHMGSRKIMVSQMNRQETLTQDTLQHLSEEARHAYFFKRQAERMAGHALDGYTEENTMARVPALMYFGRLDAGISKTVLNNNTVIPEASQSDAHTSGIHKDSSEATVTPGSPPFKPAGAGRGDDNIENDPDNQCYPWVSMIVELRACWLYHIYHEVLEKSSVKLSLKSLLAEEDHHLAEMFEMVGENTDLLKTLSAYETELFEKVWAQIQKAHNPVQMAA